MIDGVLPVYFSAVSVATLYHLLTTSLYNDIGQLADRSLETFLKLITEIEEILYFG